MPEPRIAEILEHRKDIGPDGKPTRLAQYGQKIKAYLDEIESLRTQLSQASEEVTQMEARAASMETQLKGQENLRHDLVYDAQDAAVRASMSDTAGGAALMLRQVEERQARVDEFDKGFSGAKERVERVRLSIANKRSVIRKSRDVIALRMNTISSLLDRASATEPELGAAPAATPAPKAPGASASGQQGGAGSPQARRPRRIRIIRRR